MCHRSVWCGFGKLSSGWNSAAASKHTRSKWCVNPNLQRHTSTLSRTQYNRFNSHASAEVSLHKNNAERQKVPLIFVLCIVVKLRPSNKVVKSQLCLDGCMSTTAQESCWKKEKKRSRTWSMRLPVTHVTFKRWTKTRKQRNKFLPCLMLHWMF